MRTRAIKFRIVIKDIQINKIVTKDCFAKWDIKKEINNVMHKNTIMTITKVNMYTGSKELIWKGYRHEYRLRKIIWK